jgi:CheY-like chemotaxis protein
MSKCALKVPAALTIPGPSRLCRVNGELRETRAALLDAARSAGMAEAPDCRPALVDMRMPPGQDGAAAIEQLRPTDSALQVIICTAYTRTDCSRPSPVSSASRAR